MSHAAKKLLNCFMQKALTVLHYNLDEDVIAVSE